MVEDRFPDSKPSGKRARRAISIVLGLVFVNVAYFTIRQFTHAGDPCRSLLASAYDRAVALDLHGDKPAAIAAYTEDLQRNPRDVETLKNRAYDYAELGQLDAAQADLNEALKLQPHDWDLLGRRADVYLKLGQFDRAIADLTQAVQIAPGIWSNWSARGNVYMAHGDLDAAIADYTRSLAADKKTPVDAAYFPRGIAYLRAGKFDLAKADFATYAAAHFGDADAVKGRDCAAQSSNTGDCAIPYPTSPDPMTEQLLRAAGRSLSGCEQS